MGIFKLLAVGAMCAVSSFAAPATIVAGSGQGGHCAICNGVAIIPAADIYLAGSSNGYKLDPGAAMSTAIGPSGYYAAEPGDGKPAPRRGFEAHRRSQWTSAARCVSPTSDNRAADRLRGRSTMWIGGTFK
ncbi:hypothetical protein [Lysobacter gummosus]|uniref:Uncharacterized protein n=1 Tax=Lysobacter gummosus TaxID=262324 RepID=A0ABY3XE01_9GAMM|nr:hypothetical protein [Lysobacter gummosus]ALN94022.1 hypothetical protein LG3211_5089 [Lysobacter gummosus]UNP29457.1 hypothetical protein MOV92_23845 [Lysobacter gummosus]